MSPTMLNLSCGGVVGVAVGALGLVAFAAPRSAAEITLNSKTSLFFPTPHGPREFIVHSPDEPASAAELKASTAALADGQPATVPGYRITGRIVVHASTRAPVDEIAGAVGASVGSLGGARLNRGQWLVSGLTVRQTVEVATALNADPRIEHAHVDIQQPTTLRDLPTDPGVTQQWHLKNTVNPNACIDVEPVWDDGYTGSGITVGIIEIGFDPSHPDLDGKFAAAASQPDAGYSAHGNATAGLVGAVANNGIGGVGVAFDAAVSRQYIGGPIDNAAAFDFRNDLNDIKSNSWGPVDNGTIAFIAPEELQALSDATSLGRAGKGTVIVWAGGNGGQFNDRVDYDPYASSRYSIAVGAIDNDDREAVYNERGSSLMLVTTSSYDFFGSDGSGIYTTYFSPDYTDVFGGTSAAAPIGAGVVALMLEANPSLTWRDVAHVLIKSARHVNPTDWRWSSNGGGLMHNERFGFGAIDAHASVNLAKVWPGVRPAVEVTYPAQAVGTPIADNDSLGLTETFSVYPNMVIERVQVVLTAPHDRLGDLRVSVIAPTGTQSTFALPRSDYSLGYNGYTFTSVRHWDENPRGVWTFKIADEVAGQTGTLTSWQLRLIGAERKCPCDWNSSGTITVQDLFDFLTAWFSQQADFNNSAGSTVQDLFDFLSCFFQGTPPAGC